MYIPWKKTYIWFKMTQQIEHKLQEIILLCKAHQVTSFAMFGSAARDQMHTHSDFDFLVQFSEDLNVLAYADNYFSLLDKLKELFGSKIDLVTLKSLKNPVLIEEINRSKVDLYAA